MEAPMEAPAERMEVPPFAQEAAAPPPEAVMAGQLGGATNPSVPPLLQRRGPPHHGRGPLPEVRAAPRWARLLPIAWLVSVIVVVIIVLGLLLLREEIALAWPPFARLAGVMGD